MPTYEVIGDKAVLGATKGETVVVNDPALARQLQRGGHIGPERKKKATRKKKGGTT